MKNIFDDKDFIKWIEQKRNSKRLIKQMGIEDLLANLKRLSNKQNSGVLVVSPVPDSDIEAKKQNDILDTIKFAT